jgi:hypothetical protein
MTCWVYKCNSQNRENQRAFGDWREFFEENEPDQHWGNSEWVPDLAQLEQGALVIAYQTDRNEIVGLAKVRQSTRRDGCLHLRPVSKIGVKVHPLKVDPAIDAIKAFKPGPVRTIYTISDEEAILLLEAAGVEPGLLPPVDGDPEEGFHEGGKRSAAQSIRSDRLREEAKRKYGLKCYCCGFKFEDFYGEIARDRAIVHHLETFSGVNGTERVSTVEDVKVVCANCHYVIHFGKEPMDVDKLKSLIETTWNRWTEQGVARKKQPSDRKRSN